MSKRRTGDSRLGHDPLEWLHDDGEPESSSDVSPSSKSRTEQTAVAKTEQVPDAQKQGEDIILPERITVQVVEALQQEWLVLIKSSPSEVQIHAEHLIHADAAGVQLLFAFIKCLEEKECKVRLLNVNAHMVDVFKLAGLSVFFDKFIDAA
jgi:anti-anti-sigma regulatory factor